MGLNFEKFANVGNQFVKQLSVELGHHGDTDRTGRVLKSVLHALRNQLTIEESMQVLAQLPMFLKAIYADGWTEKKKKKIKHLNEFLDSVWEEDGALADKDFKDKAETERACVIVFLVLRKYISEGEMDDIAAILPEELKSLIKPEFII